MTRTQSLEASVSSQTKVPVVPLMFSIMKAALKFGSWKGQSKGSSQRTAKRAVKGQQSQGSGEGSALRACSS